MNIRLVRTQLMMFKLVMINTSLEKEIGSASPYPEDRILVVGKKEDGVYVFAAEVISHVDGQITEAWKQKGGKTWQFNYKIRPVSSPTFLSWQQIDKISGSSKSMDKRIFQDRFQPQNDGTRITEVGTSRDRIYSHLTANF